MDEVLLFMFVVVLRTFGLTGIISMKLIGSANKSTSQHYCGATIQLEISTTEAWEKLGWVCGKKRVLGLMERFAVVMALGLSKGGQCLCVNIGIEWELK